MITLSCEMMFSYMVKEMFFQTEIIYQDKCTNSLCDVSCHYTCIKMMSRGRTLHHQPLHLAVVP